MILLSLKDKTIWLQPLDHLGDRFDIYKQKCREVGAIFDSTVRQSHIQIGQLYRTQEALKEAGFEIELDPDLKEFVRTQWKALQHDDLFPFQKQGALWLSLRHRATLGDEMGLGKTIQSLIAIPPNAPVIVVCPAAVKSNWRDETKIWRSDLAPELLSGRNSFVYPKPGQMVITNFEILPPLKKRSSKRERHKLQLTEEPDEGTVLIVDECHSVKETSSQRHKKVKLIGKACLDKNGKVWFLSGTPMLNKPLELFNVLSCGHMEKEVFGNWPTFVKLFHGWKLPFGGWDWGKPEPEVIPRLKRAILRRRRKEVLPQLPVKTHRTMQVEIDTKTKNICDATWDMVNEAGVNLEEYLETASKGKHNKIAFEEISKVRVALAAAKIPAAAELIESYEEAQEPLVVFSDHRAPIDAIGEREGWVTVTGSSNDKQREDAIQRFMEGKTKGIALTIKAGGVGITLTKASHVLFVDLAWTPALNEQAEDRVCRIGQTRGVLVTHLVGDHVMDEKIQSVLTDKKHLLETVNLN